MTRSLTFFFGIFIGLVAQFTQAADLFPKGVSRSFQRLDTLEDDATIGGYAMYQGGRTWKTLAIQDQTNNMNIRIGTAQFVSPVGNNFFAEMRVVASLSGAEEYGYFSADVCSPAKAHLFVSKKAGGTMDNCLTIDPYAANIGGRDLVTLVVNVRNSQSNWRLYDTTIYLNLAYLGYTNTTISDWSATAVANDAGKGKLIEKVGSWAKQLQDGVNTAIAYRKPQDAFASVPPLSSLMVWDETALKAPSQSRNAGSSYVFCESSKTMVLEGAKDCP
ncbi:hypothetical protein [Rhodoferax saidenbachensis]|uniref:Uncharacterized protein n=1 Tax=Rhodoferax saidenbachensis TaxID=1484693 RepID=A0ABU1ZK45_9BURK|nr:hypothetical protein [Rhodoferax saidenbachensis]MDR7305748.1 hypothetical protein [Rhodoferax saidenbachensis]